MPWRRRTSGCCSRCDCEGPPEPRRPAPSRSPPASHPPSPRRYRDLHTFELQAPTRLIEWARGNRECEAGSAEGRRGARLESGGEGCRWLAGGKEEAQGPGRDPCGGRRGKGGPGFGPVWGPGREARVQGQDSRVAGAAPSSAWAPAQGLAVHGLCSNSCLSQGGWAGQGGSPHRVPGSSCPPLQGVCVAGYGQSDGNEILQLIPPPTLLTKETQVSVAARAAPDLSDLLGLIFSETKPGLGSLHGLLPVAVTRAWPGIEQLWLKGKAHKSPVCWLVTLSCSCSADSLGCGHFISRYVNESISWGKRTDEDSKPSEEGTC